MQRLHPGVHLLGCAPPSLAQRMRAAVLFAGEGTVLSHRSAAVLWRIQEAATRLAVIDVTVCRGHVRSRPGLCVHRSRTLCEGDIRIRGGLPVTSPARTVLDMAAIATSAEVASALTEATVHGLVSGAEIRALISRAPTAKGAARLLRMLEAEEEHGYTRAESERLLRALLKPSGLPMPAFNVRICGHLVDCSWAAQRVILEVDGYGFHRDRVAFESDRRRDQELVAAGWRVIRTTWRQLTREPTMVLVRIAQVLAVN